MKIKVINKSKYKLPEYATDESEGVDLRPNLESNIIFRAMERYLVPTGLFIEIPIDYEAQIRPRNGLAFKKVITVLNSPGTIDADYRAEVCIILVNLLKKNSVIEDGKRICQMIIASHEKADWESVNTLLDSKRGSGEFGHTGKK
jgi:dUTP pyrophosphatase